MRDAVAINDAETDETDEIGGIDGNEAADGRAEERTARAIRFVSVVLPCLNEEAAVGETVAEARRGLGLAGLRGEVIVVDNGSTDRSSEVAEAAGARVVREPTRGYGAAHRAGIAAAKGDVVVMADADQTYDLEGLGALVQPLMAGADMVVGSRLQGNVAPGAMPVLHRYVGTPVITRILRLLTGASLSDSQSGYRAFWREQATALDLQAPGMEYASEMLLKAARAGLDIREVPSDYRARVGESKLETLTDGWRHIRMLLVLSPHLTLILPAILSMVIGFGLLAASPFVPGAVGWVPVIAGALLVIMGAQVAFLGALAAERSELSPAWIQERLAIFRRPSAVDVLLRRFLLLAFTGVLLDAVLVALWGFEVAVPAVPSLVGIAQAAIVVGLGGVASLLAADFARESSWT